MIYGNCSERPQNLGTDLVISTFSSGTTNIVLGVISFIVPLFQASTMLTAQTCDVAY